MPNQKGRMKSYVIVLSAALLSACAAESGAPSGASSGRVQVSREVRDQCNREAALMYPVSLKMGVSPLGATPTESARTPGAYTPSPPPPEDVNLKERTDMIAACLRTKAGEQK